jgi:uncharacterized protein YkwD
VVLASTEEPPPALSPVELEIVELTNALRADPAGPLARHKPLPDCVANRYYDIAVDATTGQPEPVPPLALDPLVTTVLARTWADELRRSGRFEHRPSGEAHGLYGRLGQPVTAWGENIAWFEGLDPTQTALIHFEGWRESDAGHFCSLITGRFTTIGVGELTVGDQSWAVQNFYR